MATTPPDPLDSEEALSPCWVAVGNIVRSRPYGPGGLETRAGTKHFAPGAKVYIVGLYSGQCDRMVVIGQHRMSKRLIRLVIDVRLVENLRAKVCYQPAVLAKIHEYAPWPQHQRTQATAEEVCQTIIYWQAELKKVPDAFKGAVGSPLPRQHHGASADAAGGLFSGLWRRIRYFLTR